MKHVLLAFLLLSAVGWPPDALAQRRHQPKPLPPANAPTQSARLELSLEAYTSDVQVQVLPDDSSAVLLVEQESLVSRHSKYNFHKLDHALQTSWTKPLEVPKDFEFTKICAEEAMVYALFQRGSQSHKLWVAALNSRTGEISTTTFDTKVSDEVYELKALGGNLFVTVQVEQHVTVLLLNLRTGQHQFLPSVYEPVPAQLTFLADSVSKRAKFVVSQTNGVKSRLQVKQLSAQGKLLRTEYVQAASDRGLLTAQISPGDSTERLLTGTYTLRDPRYSQGLFATDLAAGVTPTGARESLRFYDFFNFKHFFDFMHPAREARFRQRGARRRATAGQFRLHYRLLMHDLLPFQNGYVLVAEVYYPHYRYDSYGYSYMMSPVRSFDGYRTTQAIICGFDRHGNLLWDNNFVLKDVQHTDLLETVRLRPLPDGKRLALAYLDDDQIRYKIIDRTAPSPNDLSVPIQTAPATTAKEQGTSTRNAGMLAWYGNRFLAYGYQHVRVDGGRDRDVFFLNTVAFE
ncbi:hypothetical protein SAMN02745146_1208 [Hymenobacter daecheongensis DSM 21074]|uniref:Uncharacterized protein n=1 Tax=Hymenobacter daecheongensis DSM 21074 TaxID=1121955 RepID=A0A1M6CMX0_9BACT|nr:hypothetical protein [Hymenobacter daecheongensis]SHI62299.1 hypothetical protein SAMN02745146_1208 [Hymenobacter daecheongensis DSM 21074]